MPIEIYPILAALPRDHFLRNTPLGLIGAHMRNRKMKSFKSVGTWKIRRYTYNQLGQVWHDNNVFGIPVYPR